MCVVVVVRLCETLSLKTRYDHCFFFVHHIMHRITIGSIVRHTRVVRLPHAHRRSLYSRAAQPAASAHISDTQEKLPSSGGDNANKPTRGPPRVTDLLILKSLAGFVWPKTGTEGALGVKTRVVTAMSLLVGSKVGVACGGLGNPRATLNANRIVVVVRLRLPGTNSFLTFKYQCCSRILSIH